MPISKNTLKLAQHLFPAEEWEAAVALLETRYGNDFPLGKSKGDPKAERIRFAALKFSGGDLKRLHDAIQLARTDWRDLLAAAGFGHSVTAHSEWADTS